MRPLMLPLLGILIVCSAVGCGPARTDVTGQVTYNGKTIDEVDGAISFFGADGVPISAVIERGNYRARGVCLGENKVSIAYQKPVVAAKAGSRVSKAAKQEGIGDSPFLIPECYVTPNTSGLTVVIEKNAIYSPKLVDP